MDLKQNHKFHSSPLSIRTKRERVKKKIEVLYDSKHLTFRMKNWWSANMAKTPSFRSMVPYCVQNSNVKMLFLVKYWFKSTFVYMPDFQKKKDRKKQNRIVIFSFSAPRPIIIDGAWKISASKVIVNHLTKKPFQESIQQSMSACAYMNLTIIRSDYKII